MSTSESFRALRRANPRHDASFAESVDGVAGAVRARVATSSDVLPHSRPRRRLIGASAAAAAIAVAGVAAFLTIGSLGSSPGVENARAAVEQAAVVSAASAEQSGTAVVHMTQQRRVLGRQDRALERRRRGDCRVRAPIPAGRTGDASRRREALRP